jgi:hypothetical protein
MSKTEEAVPDGYEVVYTKYITRNGKRIPPPNGRKVWRLVIKKKAA